MDTVLCFDESRRPLVIARLAGEPTRADIDELERSLDALLDRHEPYAVIWDLAATEIPGRALVMDTLRWTRRMRLRSREEFVQAVEPIPSYAAYVMGPRVVRVYRFIEQMTPRSEVPTGVFETMEDALAVAEQMLERFGAPAPPARGARAG